MDMRPNHPVQRLLVISENPELSLHLRAELEKHDFGQPLGVDFCYTVRNRAPQAMLDIGAASIDIKDPATVARVLRDYDLVFSLHCKQIFPRQLVEQVCCINFHPGLNPYNRGWFPQAFSLLNGLPIGATIHVMDAEVDHGGIIAQQAVQIAPADTSLEVYRKVIAAEKHLIAQHIASIIRGRFHTVPPPTDGNYNSIQDYRQLCELDLAAVGTLGQHLQLLRATTHGSFRNAYFTAENGKRYYVKIQIEEDDAVTP